MKHEPRPAIDMEKQLGWGGVSGDLQGGANSVSQFDGVSYMAPAAGSVALWGEGSEKGQWPLLALMPDTSVPPCVPLVPFKLLPQCWSSEGVSLSKSICGFFKGNCLGLQNFLPLTQSPLVLTARSCGDLPSWHWGAWFGSGTPCS